MKKLLQLFALAAIVMGCTKEEIITEDGLYTITGYTSVETKTDFGTPVGNSIPFVWSNGDKIWCGNRQSNAAANVNGASAEFTFSSQPSGNEIYYNMTGTSATTAVVPVIQDASKTLGENGDFGYGTLQGDSFTLKHATSYIWFNITSLPDGATLESIRLHAGSDIIAGTATFNSTTLTPSDGRSIVELKTDISQPTSGADAVMVVFPGNISNAVVTYQFAVGNETKYYEEQLQANLLEPGNTYKIDANLSAVQLKEYVLRTLTFEDNHTMFDVYSLGNGTEISKWSNLIDEQQYGGSLLYDYSSILYTWSDINNTYLTHSFITPYWGGGHAISNYVNDDFQTLPAGSYGWYELQLQIPIAPWSGDNFAVHNGYKDFFNQGLYDASLQTLEFSDSKERIIESMRITNTNYALNSMTYGDGFNTPANDDSYFNILIYGYDNDDNQQGDVITVPLLKVGKQFVLDWTLVNLSVLGPVAKIAINFEASADFSGSYGLNVPAYFAYDDVAVRFE